VALHLARSAGLSWLQASAVLIPLVALEGILRLLVSRRLPAFEQELMARLQQGRNDELLPLIREQRFLALAGPRHYLQGKLGMIYRQLGQHSLAAATFREALQDAPPARQFALALGLADSLYAIGEDSEAERLYRQSLDDKHRSARACANLSRLIRKRGGDKEEAEAYLRLAVDDARDGKLRCELVWLLLEQGKVEEAAWQLQLAGEEMATAPAEEQELLARTRAAVEACRTAAPDDPPLV
jgi:Flp pilus assembly protein TadD